MEVCLFDGHIRNRLQLCDELRIPPSKRQETDRAILEARFNRWGCDIGNHINGSFSLAILDEESGRLFCARDPLGIKPFYYGFDPDGALRYGSAIGDVVGETRRELMRTCDKYRELYQTEQVEATCWA